MNHESFSGTLQTSMTSAAINEVWEWINNFITPFIGHVITYPCWD